MTISLITGANKGIGHETARRVLEAGHTFYVAAGDPERGRSAATSLGARFVHLDVTSDDSIRLAADIVGQEEGHLDVLVNKPPSPDPCATSTRPNSAGCCSEGRHQHADRALRPVIARHPHQRR
jgi:NAD(P)-dependent dehydrogenase (short-subunit alcohol dehydrogenase family)